MIRYIAFLLCLWMSESYTEELLTPEQAIDMTIGISQERQQNIRSQLAIAYQTYVTNLEMARLEKSNEDITKENLDVTLDEFRIGTITTVEFRAAQLNYIQDITEVVLLNFRPNYWIFHSKSLQAR